MSFVLVEKNNFIATVIVHKPEALNALNSQVLRDLDQAFETLSTDDQVRVVILTGSGEKAFVAGADIKEINSLDFDSALEFAKLGQEVFLKIENFPKPVIAAVNGFALGGGLELALSCDFIWASQKAKLGLPESTLGLMPGFGGSVRLARRVSAGYAKQMTYSGDMITADEALRIGLVNRVCAPEELLAGVQQLAQTIATRAPRALTAIKNTVETTYGMDTESAMVEEREAFAELFKTQDCREGTLAFIEKRKPNFTGQ